MKSLLFMSLLVSGLGCSKHSDPKPSESDHSAARASAVERLMTRHLSNGGWIGNIVDGSLTQDGEALIWSSIAMGHFDCPTGDVIEAALRAPIERTGDLDRMDPVLDSWKDRPLNFDGLAGWYYGVARRWVRCKTAPLKAAWIKQSEAIASRNGKIHRLVDVKLPPHFDTTPKAISWAMGLGSAPDQREIDLMTFEVGSWAQATVSAKAACYRIHLGYLHLSTLRYLGFRVTPTVFCDAVKKVDMPLERHWCGYSGLEDYVSNFQYDLWDYRHQRCGDWETPDGGGEETPALDLITGIDALRGEQ